MTPEEWLANFEATIADVKEKAAEFQHNLEASGATESSPDGGLRVTVAPNGALTNLTIDDAAMRGSGGELAAQIMRLARKAQRAAAVNVATAFAPLAGTDSESLHMVTGYLPPDEDEPEEPSSERGYAFTEHNPEPEQAPPAPPRPAEPSRRPPRQRSGPSDDEEFGQDQIFGKDDEW